MLERLIWVLVTVAAVFGVVWVHTVDRVVARVVSLVVDVLGGVMFVALGCTFVWVLLGGNIG